MLASLALPSAIVQLGVASLALLFAIVSIGTTGVRVLSRCTIGARGALVKPSLKEYTGSITLEMEEQAKKWKARIEACEASLTGPHVEIAKEAGPSMAEKTIPLMMIVSKPNFAWVGGLSSSSSDCPSGLSL